MTNIEQQFTSRNYGWSDDDLCPADVLFNDAELDQAGMDSVATQIAVYKDKLSRGEVIESKKE